MSVSPIQFGPALQLDSQYQHQWFLADTNGQQLSASACAGLAQLELRCRFGQLQVRAPGMLLLELALDVLEDDDSFRCIATDPKGNPIAVINEGPLAAAWFENVLGQSCLLLKKDPGHPDVA